MTRDEVVAKMTARCSKFSLLQLGAALEMLDRKPKLDDAERLTRTVFIDVICERCPEAETAFAAWADSDSMDIRAPITAIVAAAKRSN